MDRSRSKRLFKKLTPENWREHDTTADHIVQTGDVPTKLTDDDWTAVILEPKLSLAVPEEVHNLFEVAQGVLCYGCFFYPLYTLGSEQFYRVLEAALKHKCSVLGAAKSINSFAKSLRWLEERNVLTGARLVQWNAARNLRNMTSHAERQALYDPTWAVRGVILAAELINELFDGEGARG